MLILLISMAVYGSFLVLIGCGVSHANRLREFAAVLADHRTVPKPLTIWSAILISGIEISLGASGLISAAFGAASILRSSLFGAAGLFTAFFFYAMFLMFRRPGVPCGCIGQDGDSATGGTGPEVPARALTLAMLEAFAAPRSAAVGGVGTLPAWELTVILSSSATLALLATHLSRMLAVGDSTPP